MLTQPWHDVVERPTFPCTEQTSPEFTATLVGEDGVTPIPGSTLTTLVLTLYADNGDLTIINDRDHQDVLQQNGVTVDEFGLLTWILDPLDLRILDDALPFERHIALLEWTWGVGRAGKFELVLVVRNLAKVS